MDLTDIRNLGDEEQAEEGMIRQARGLAAYYKELKQSGVHAELAEQLVLQWQSIVLVSAIGQTDTSEDQYDT